MRHQPKEKTVEPSNKSYIHIDWLEDGKIRFEGDGMTHDKLAISILELIKVYLEKDAKRKGPGWHE